MIFKAGQPWVVCLTSLCLACSSSTFAVDKSQFDLPDQPQRMAKFGVSLDLPDLGVRPSIVQQQQELKLGELALRQVAQEAPLLEDAWSQDELNKIFSKIYNTTELGPAIGLVLINDNSINAFAVPGGLFAVNTGTILSARRVDEVAAVMGHEIAHVLQRHYSRSQQAFKYDALLSIAGILASIMLASKSPDAAGAIAFGSQAAMLNQQLAYSRDQEREADRVGMYLMHTAGYDPIAMAEFFETMDRSTSKVGMLPDFWMTHPLSSERMSEARLRAAQFPKRTQQLSLSSEENFRILQYRLGVLSKQIVESKLRGLAARDDAALLALATYDGMQGRFDEGRQLVQKFQNKHPDTSIAAITLAEIELKARQPDRAINALLPVYQLMPESRALTVTLAEAYSMSGRAQDAVDLLIPLSEKNKHDLLVWQALETASSRLPDSPFKAAQVLRYRAENQFWHGNVDLAIRSLLRASVLAQKNYPLQAKIEIRQKEMQQDYKFKP